MTVPVQTPFTETTANGSTTVFPFGFLCLDEEDLEVSKDGAVITAGFTIAGIGILSGGSVTFTVAPTNGTVITMALKPVAQREIDYQQSGDWLAASLNRDFDRIWLAIRSLGQSILTSIKLPFSTTAEPIITDSAVARANKYLSFDGDGNLDLTVGPDLEAAIDAQVAAEAAAAIIAGFENKGAWLTATAYAVNNLAQESGTTYICLVAHTSGTFATDYSGGKWAIFAQKGAAGTGTGDMLSTNNLGDVANAATSRANLGLGTAATKATGTTSGTVPLWESLPFNAVSDKSSGFTVGTGDRGKVFNCTATMTIALTAAATLAAGFTFAVRNSSSGSVVLDPDSTETIDESSTVTLSPGESCIVVCDGDEFYTIGSFSPVFSKEFISSQQTITLGGLLTLTHSLGAVPTLIQCKLKCISGPDSGWATNDEIFINNDFNQQNSGAGQSVYADATNVYVRFSNAAYQTHNKSTGVPTNLTTANWKLIVRAWA